MTKKKQKYYVVWKGVKSGIFTSWEDCKKQVLAFQGAQYKSFSSMSEAEIAFKKGYSTLSSKPNKNILQKTNFNEKVIWESLSVDAASSGNPGIMEYRGVWTKSGQEVFKSGPYPDGTNNIGEFLALVHGIAQLQKLQMYLTPIYSDSRTAMSWLKKKKAKTTLEPSEVNGNLFELITRAEQWLENNEFKNPILKWNTKLWGEIPADFGRK